MHQHPPGQQRNVMSDSADNTGRTENQPPGEISTKESGDEVIQGDAAGYRDSHGG